MREYSLKTSAIFWEELGEALDYIAYDLLNPIAVRNLYEKTIAKINALRFAPKINKITHELYSAKVKGYRIIYKVIDSKNVVLLLHFWYYRRDIGKLLR